MKIHIVQKGDTLWELSKQYGVDFEELKQANSQLSSPDMIMPGMKIKIPSTSKTVKKGTSPKEVQKKETIQGYKDTSPKPMPVIKEDDHKKEMIAKPVMPVQPAPQMPVQPLPQMHVQPMVQVPIMEQEFQNYTTINFPQMPQIKEEKHKKEHVKEKAQPVPKPMPKPKPMPTLEQTLPTLQQPQPQQPQCQPMPQQAPVNMIPLCCHVIHPCYPPVPFPLMVNAADGFQPTQQMAHQHQQFVPFNPMPFNGPNPNMEMPMPMHTAQKNDCGCNSGAPVQQHALEPYPVGNDMHNYQPPMFHSRVPENHMYPPQFEANKNNNNSYPSPPAYPDFSKLHYREEDKTTGE